MSLAYQISGAGPLDLVFVPGLAYPIDLLWEDPGFVHCAKRLGGFSRTIWPETRGTAASGGEFLDRFVEAIADADMTAVLDAAGCEQVALVGSGHVGSWLITYAAMHPERVRALVLIDTYAHGVREDDYPIGLRPDALERFVAAVRERWGTGATMEILAPSKGGDESFRERYARSERLGSSPEVIAAANRAAMLRDVRHGALNRSQQAALTVSHTACTSRVSFGGGR